MKNFYKELKAFTNFGLLFDQSNYQEVPEDWFVLLSDVKGSTEAVNQGKYKDVNMVGALGISSVLNETKEQLPFVFGGDGGTILVPPYLKDQAVVAFRKSMHISKEMYGLELRAGIISVKEINSLRVKIEVSKYELSPKNYIAQFKGRGLKVAESLIKLDTKYLLTPLSEQPNLDGLSCRWSPVPNKKGTILSLICQSDDESTIQEVISELEVILESPLSQASPISEERIKASWPPPIHLEAKANSNPKTYWKTYAKLVIVNFIAYVITRFDLTVGNFSTLKYKKEIQVNSDFKKYDDSLKLVLDCSKYQAAKIREYLSKKQKEGKLLFGYHESAKAMMTCLVMSTDNEHVHFIDGDGGGYTQASKFIKASLIKSKDKKVA